jgi:DNA-binding NarL/FixJ family response regulator
VPDLHAAILARLRVGHNVGPPPSCDDHAVRDTVLLVDDHSDFRAAARAVLEAGDFEVVGEAGTGADGIRAARRLRPRVVLLDVRLPDLDGFAVADRLAELPEPPAVVLISSRGERAYGARLDRAAARGFLSKADLTVPALHLVLR